ncbi:MAG: hypothetical protein ACJA0Q_001732 [Saprospiraceae bacterium]
MLRSFTFIKSIVIALLCFASSVGFAQLGTVKGILLDDQGKGIDGVQVTISNSTHFTFSDSTGKYSIKTKPSKRLFVAFSHLSYNSTGQEVSLTDGEVKILDLNLESAFHLTDTLDIETTKTVKTKEVTIDADLIDKVVSPSDDALAIIKQQAAVASNNELSSAYSVRGGNFDENLIYVNGIEIYRPFLIRSGQQEGLSFVNSDLVKSLTFSAGGFDAQYGDKLSSVLDIKYREPKSFKASVNVSMLGGRAHIEGRIKDKFSFIMGTRYKTNSYLLGTLDTEAEYNPQFFDYQTYLTYRPTSKIKIGFLGNISSNRYEMNPVSRQTNFGGINQAFQLNVGLAGQEVNRFDAFFGALSLDIQASDNVVLKFTGSAFSTSEEETFDIAGAYELGELETNQASENFGEISNVVGTGSFLDHTRNFLDADIFNVSHHGIMSWSPGKLLWGASYQQEHFKDDLLEWKYVDSADFSIPTAPSNELILNEYLQSRNELTTSRINAYLQNNWELLENSKSELFLNTGVRANYWSYSKEILVSPRASLIYVPNSPIDSTSTYKGQLSYRLAWGYYYQPPFYRELRNLQGMIMPDVKAQKSIHYVAGVDYDFQMWKVPFTWRTEAFYKQLDKLIPFEMENVKLKYFGENSGQGYATGMETRINGEFVEDLESWFSFSLLKTEETIDDFTYTDYFNAAGDKIVFGFTDDQVITDSTVVDKGSMPRPTDQRFSFKIFFQDRMPKFHSFKVHLNFVYASGLPFGPSESVQARNAFRIPAYRRVDIGFSYDIVENGQRRKNNKLVEIPEKHFLHVFEHLWIRAEVFNLLDISNTISYFWISDIHNRQYAIPNFLTQRLINVRLSATF